MEKKFPIERRKYPRARTRKRARYRIIHSRNPDRISRTEVGTVLNISGGGVLLGVRELVTEGLHISYDEDVRERNWVALEIELLPGRPPIRALGRVAWYQKAAGEAEHAFDVGIEFQEIRDQDRKTITDFVHTCQQAGDPGA